MKFDPVKLELIKNAIGAVVDEMVLTVVRVAYSSIMKDTMDLSSAFFDRRGRMIAQGLSVPLHLGSFPDAMTAVLQEFGNDIAKGDVIILNDPYHGGMHLPDIFMFKPVYIDRHLLGFSVLVAHHNDVGGRVAGSSAADSTEIFQEGIRLPPVKLYEGGIRNDALYKTIRLNVRVPDTVSGDLDAQLAACRICERGVADIVVRYGITEVEEAFEALLEYSERGARAAIEALPDGSYECTDYLDDDGVNASKPVKIKVRLDVIKDQIVADFEGSSPQVAGAINATYSFTKSAVYFALRSIIKEDLPNNSGFFRPITVKAPFGSVLNPAFPAACAARGVTGFRVIDTLFGALALVVPDRIRAAGEGGTTSYSLASYDASGNLNLFREAIMGAWGAGLKWDGIDGVANPAANIGNAPIELIEHEAPVLIEKYGLVADSGGAGAMRGGLGVERQFQLLAERGRLQLRSDRRMHPPSGRFKGQAGASSKTYLLLDEKKELLPTKFIRELQRGWRINHTTAGGGGYGDPMKRCPASVLEDVRRGKVTIETAEKIYGVKVHADPWRVDEKTTTSLRMPVEDPGK